MLWMLAQQNCLIDSYLKFKFKLISTLICIYYTLKLSIYNVSVHEITQKLDYSYHKQRSFPVHIIIPFPYNFWSN